MAYLQEIPFLEKMLYLSTSHISNYIDTYTIHFLCK